jgi:hypothetical protein
MNTVAISMTLILAGSSFVGACTPKEKSDALATASATVATVVPTVSAPTSKVTAQPSVAPTPPSTSKLAITCPQNTWNELRESKPTSWQKESCGPISVSYKFSPAAGARKTDNFVLLQRYPLKGRRAAAVMKEAVEALAPNLGKPKQSRGGCKMAAETRKTLLELGGPDLVAEGEANTHAQGGYRAVDFEADGYRITVMLNDADEKNAPGMAILKWTDQEVSNAAFPVVPWEGTTLCD